MPSSIVSTSLKVTALVVFVIGLASHQHAITTSIAERATFRTSFVTFFGRVFTRDIDSGGNETFTLSQRQWKLFEVFQEADANCDCTVTCADTNSRIDVYMTYESRPRLNDNWEGWDCKETLASNTQTCNEAAPGPNSRCTVAVRGDSFDRPHSECTISCNVDSIV